MGDEERDDQAMEVIRGELKAIRQGMRRVFVSVAVLTMIVILLAIAIYGSLVNYFGGDALLFASATLATAGIGFLCGWIAHRRVAG